MLKGNWMYSRQDVKDLIKMIEIGVLSWVGRKLINFRWKTGRRDLMLQLNALGPPEEQ
jgi:hypothetical protein